MTTSSYNVSLYTPDENTIDWGNESDITGPTQGAADTSTWIQVFDMSQLVMVCVGFIANTGTVITLLKHGESFGPPILYLLRHQSFVDAVICAMGAAMLAQPYMWKTGIEMLDTIICHLWLGQGLYWTFVLLSIWNLVAIAFERFLAVRYPLKYLDLTVGKILKGMVFQYISSVIFCGGTYIQVKMFNGQCVSDYFIQGHAGIMFFFVYSMAIFVIYYVLPCSLFFFFYSVVIITFKRRQQGELAASRIVDKASAELTKTAVVVTVVFIIAIGYDLWYYMLGNTQVVVYKKNTPVQKVGIWLAAFNSVANPFIYALLMPTYRKSVKQTFCGYLNSNRHDIMSRATESSIASVSTI